MPITVSVRVCNASRARPFSCDGVRADSGAFAAGGLRHARTLAMVGLVLVCVTLAFLIAITNAGLLI